MVEFSIRMELRLTQELADAIDRLRAGERPIPTRQHIIRQLLAEAIRARLADAGDAAR